MSLMRWNPARDLAAFPSDVLSMRKEFNRLFDNFFHGDPEDATSAFTSAWIPAVDISGGDNEYVVRMELPGVSREDVRISIQDGILTIRGEKKQESGSADYHRAERLYGAFQRSFTLPAAIVPDKIDATFRDGVLEVRLPKAEEAKPKSIEVRVK